MNPFPPNKPLARTLSDASVSSEDDASMASTVTIQNTRRTRKRFSNHQLTMLENLFHQNSHPSREDRERVAKLGDMEIKSVTIWFQNKRQTERKTAASQNPVNISGGPHSPSIIPNISCTTHTFSLSSASHRTSSPPFSTTGSSRSASSIISATGMGAPRPTLDRVASRSELRSSAPRTPRRPAPGAPAAIWDSMPSSPLAPPISPPAREFIDFGKNKSTRRTLEYACANARAAAKDGYATGMSAGFGGHPGGMSMGMAGESLSAAASSRDLRDRPGYGDGYRDSYRDGYRERDRDGYRHGQSHTAQPQPPHVSSDVYAKGRTIHRQRSLMHVSERDREDREREHEYERDRDRRERLREREREVERANHKLRDGSDSSYMPPSQRAKDGYYAHQHQHQHQHQQSQPQPYPPHPPPAAHSTHAHAHSHSSSHDRYRSHPPPPSSSSSRSPIVDRDGDAGMATDDEDQDPDHEAITPSSTWGKDDRRWTAAPAEGGGGGTSLMVLGASAAAAKLGRAGSIASVLNGTNIGGIGSGGGGGIGRRLSEGKMDVVGDVEKGVKEERSPPMPNAKAGVHDDDDIIQAALVLCGLGRKA